MIKEIDVATLQTWLSEDKAVLIDVREDNEFAAGHIEQALSVPLSTYAQKFQPENFTADKYIVLQCQAGVRSMKACQISEQLNPDREYYNLSGGLNAWVSSGLKITRI